MSYYPPASIGRQYNISVPDGSIAVPNTSTVFLGSMQIPNPVIFDTGISLIGPQLLGMYAQVSNLTVTGAGATIAIGIGVDTTPSAYSIASAISAELGVGSYQVIRSVTNSGVPGNVSMPTPGGLYMNPLLINSGANGTASWKGYIAKAFFYM